jgi:hypothetical protein
VQAESWRNKTYFPILQPSESTIANRRHCGPPASSNGWANRQQVGESYWLFFCIGVGIESLGEFHQRTLVGVPQNELLAELALSTSELSFSDDSLRS